MRERFPSVEADDVIQETLIALIKAFPVYHYSPEEKGHFRNYLTGILRNKALKSLRDERRQAEIVAELRSVEDAAPYPDGNMVGRPAPWPPRTNNPGVNRSSRLPCSSCSPTGRSPTARNRCSGAWR